MVACGFTYPLRKKNKKRQGNLTWTTNYISGRNVTGNDTTVPLDFQMTPALSFKATTFWVDLMVLHLLNNMPIYLHKVPG